MATPTRYPQNTPRRNRQSTSAIHISPFTDRPSRKCQDRALGGGAVNARSRARICAAVGAERRGIDGAEPSAMLSDVMADASLVTRTCPARWPAACRSRDRDWCAARDVSAVHVANLSRSHAAPLRARSTSQQAPRRERPRNGAQAKVCARRGRSRLGACRWCSPARPDGAAKNAAPFRLLYVRANRCWPNALLASARREVRREANDERGKEGVKDQG